MANQNERFEPCEWENCENTFNIVSQMDHWHHATTTEFDTDSMDERRYCSRECLIRDQISELEDASVLEDMLNGQTAGEVTEVEA